MRKLLLIISLFSFLFSSGQTPMSKLLRKHAVTSSYDADAQKYFDSLALDVSVTTAQKGYINTFILSMKTSGVWAINQAIYLPIWNNASANKWNLKDLRNLDAAFRLTFNSITTDTGGITGNGTSSYTDSHFTPLTDFASVNDASISLYLNLHSATLYNQDMGVADDLSSTNGMNIVRAYPSPLGTDYYRNNSTNYGAYSPGGGTTDTGYIINTRSGASAWNIYEDGASVYSGTEASTGRSTYSIWLNAINKGTDFGYSMRRWCFATIGTNKTATDAANEYQSVLTLLTAFGIN